LGEGHLSYAEREEQEARGKEHGAKKGEGRVGGLRETECVFHHSLHLSEVIEERVKPGLRATRLVKMPSRLRKSGFSQELFAAKASRLRGNGVV